TASAATAATPRATTAATASAATTATPRATTAATASAATAATPRATTAATASAATAARRATKASKDERPRDQDRGHARRAGQVGSRLGIPRTLLLWLGKPDRARAPRGCGQRWPQAPGQPHPTGERPEPGRLRYFPRNPGVARARRGTLRARCPRRRFPTT